MVPFLEQLALALRRHHPDGLADVAVVMPVRGAAAVLRKYIAQGSDRPQWSPDIMDMGGFMQRASGMRQGAPVEMLAHLYRAHTAIAGAKAEPFDEMLQWAPTTLRDMSEVDEHLLDLDVFYRELQEIDDIEEWSFRLGEPSPGQQRLMRHWRQTAALHRAMHQRMRAEGTGTAGMVARTAVERITEGHLPWKAVWFAGLPRLAPAAAQVVALLQQRGLAQVAWDTDRHYLDDPLQEAGLHLRQAIARAGPGLVPPQGAIRERPRTLHATTVPNDPAQALHAAALLEAMTDAERADTAIVLADPELLMPLLQAWPAAAANARVAMGLPLAALPVHGLMEAFMRLHTLPRAHVELPVADVERLLAHALVQRGPDDRAAIAALRAEGRPGIALGRLATIISAHGRPDAGDLEDALRPVTDPVAEMPDRTTALIAWAQVRCADDPWGREQLFRMAA
ncbi:MAG: hypothetical protein RBT71_12600, partial [Flavobacteriales bacterium]|nr:hypothetical protein [Flavobacteriales bacterium]